MKRVIDILLRTKKRNPVLVGESEPEAVVRELLNRIENKELGEGATRERSGDSFGEGVFVG